MPVRAAGLSVAGPAILGRILRPRGVEMGAAVRHYKPYENEADACKQQYIEHGVG